MLLKAGHSLHGHACIIPSCIVLRGLISLWQGGILLFLACAKPKNFLQQYRLREAPQKR